MRSLVAVFTVTCLILSLAIQGNALVGNKQLVCTYAYLPFLPPTPS